MSSPYVDKDKTMVAGTDSPYFHNHFFDSLEEFYAADERRGPSGEADYGRYWFYIGWSGRWRVSYIRNTGEVYCHRVTLDGLNNARPVEILGVVPADEKYDSMDRWTRTLDRLLDGWGELGWENQNIEWIRERIAAHAENRIPRM